MSPRNLIILGVAALAGSALLLGFTVAGAPGEDALRACLAEFLEVDVDTMEGLSGVTTDRHGATRAWIMLEDGIEARVAARRIDGKVHITQMTRMFDEGEEDIGIERARARALVFAESKYPRWGPDMVETDGKRVPMGNYLFAWRRITEDSYVTGDYVTLSLDSATGEVFSYGAGFGTSRARPRIDAEQATKIAVEHLQEQVGDRARYVVTEKRCVLSLPWSKGPVWFISFRPVWPEGRSRLRNVMVDGRNGAILTAAATRCHCRDFPPQYPRQTATA